MPDPFYVTTPIYYVNARPHIGHAYTTIVADVLARRARAKGRPTWFLTGTDEHGQKIERSALAAGIPPQQFTDEVSAAFETLWQRMGITNDQYIRTTDEAHKRGVQKLFTTLYNNGQIYLSSYTGQYSIGEEMFIEGPPGTIGPDGKPTETVTEENFFFRLSDYQLPLLNLIESDELKITPESRKNEVLSFLRGNVNQAVTPHDLGAPGSTASSSTLGSQNPQPTTNPGEPARGGGNFASETWVSEPPQSSVQVRFTARNTPYLPGSLKDLSISRSSFTWGIPVPKEIQQAAGAKHSHIIYVWLDALANYITALGYGSEDESKLNEFWPANLHLVGKEIIRFHCVYWPAFLLAAGLPLPKAVTAHGWLLFDDSKMSKSKGNIVRTETILEAFGQLCPPAPGHPASLPEHTASALDAPLKGTASAVPSPSPAQHTASAAEIRSPQFPTNSVILSERSESKDPETTGPATDRIDLSAKDPSSPALAPHTPTHQNPTPRHRDLFAADVLRYFLLREIPFGQDGSFTFEALITRYNADLANGYGNLVSRTLNLIAQNFEVVPTSELPDLHTADEAIDLESKAAFWCTLTKAGFSFELSGQLFPIEESWELNAFEGVLAGVQSQVARVDGFLTITKPWSLAKQQDVSSAKALAAILYTAAESIRIITALLYPILPFATAQVWRQLGLGNIEQAAANGDLQNLKWGDLQPGTKLGPLGPIFPRADISPDKGLARQMTQMETEKNAPTGANAAHDTTSTETTEFKETAIASQPEETKKPLSKLVDETTGHTALTNPAHFDPAAGPRTSSLPEPGAAHQVAGSSAVTTERPATPHHTEAEPSGIFANNLRAPSIPEPHPEVAGSTGSPVAAEPSGIFTTPADQSPQITIDDFAKVELRVAKILVCERIPKADKLLRLEVDLGSFGKRQILSGIAEWYTPEDLIGRRIVVITNLAPRKMRGLESHGMLLAASTEGGKPYLATFDAAADALPLGSRLK